MKKFIKIVLVALPLLMVFFQPTVAKAEDFVYCYCQLDLGLANADQIKSTNDTICQQMTADKCSGYAVILATQDKVNFVCSQASSTKDCQAKTSNWKASKTQSIKDVAATKSQIIPACALSNKIGVDCLDITIFVQLMLNIVNYLLSFVGGLALLFIIYGGFVLIFSGGSQDKVTQGKDIIMAALIGLAVAFCGYVLVSFLGSAIGISGTYTLK